jgi:hypothetical protein
VLSYLPACILRLSLRPGQTLGDIGHVSWDGISPRALRPSAPGDPVADRTDYCCRCWRNNLCQWVSPPCRDAFHVGATMCVTICGLSTSHAVHTQFYLIAGSFLSMPRRRRFTFVRPPCPATCSLGQKGPAQRFLAPKAGIHPQAWHSMRL